MMRPLSVNGEVLQDPDAAQFRVHFQLDEVSR